MTPSSISRARTPLFVAILAIIVVGAGGLWYLFLRPAGPPPVVVASGAPPTETPAPGASAATSAPVSSSATASGGALAGSWKVDASIGKLSDFSGSFVGYRVQEQLVNIGGNTAVGRTPDVSGSLTLEGTSVTKAEFTAKVARLTSDERARDGRVTESLNTRQFPDATFVLSSPIVLGGIPVAGQEITVTAPGKLTIRGVTRDVQFPLTAKLAGSTLTVKGALEIRFADFSIPKPTSFSVLSIADTGVIEVQLQMTRG